MKPNDASVTLKLSHSLMDRIDQWAADNWCTRAAAIRTLLERGLNQHDNETDAMRRTK